MTHSKRFTLSVVIVAALTFTPTAFAGEATEEPSVIEVLLQAIVGAFAPEACAPADDMPTAHPGDVSNAGPNIIFIG